MIKPAKVHFNYTIKKISVTERGQKTWHTDYILLRNCYFKINRAERERCLLEQVKNVHAYIEGYIVGEPHPNLTRIERLYYNPFRDTCFKTNSCDDVAYRELILIEVDNGHAEIWSV
jgi:hypothetical protein